MMMKKAVFVFAVTWVCCGYASANLTPLHESAGKMMVQRDFLLCPFEKGAFGNDVSRLLPFLWSTSSKDAYSCFSAAEQQYSDGIAWEIRKVVDGKMMPSIHEWTPSTEVWFQPFQLFVVKWKDGRCGICFHNEARAYSPRKNEGERITLVDSTWHELNVETNGVPRKTRLEGGVRSLFGNTSIASICNVVPHRYRGANAEVVGEPSDSQKRLDECANQIWSLSESQKERIAILHRDYVKKLHPEAVVTNIYLVVGDGNFDGVCDAYASCDAEQKDDMNYTWSLYVSSGSCFCRAEDDMSRTFDRIEAVYVDAEVCVSKDSFFRLDRSRRPSYIMPVTIVDGKPEFWSYANHRSCVQKFRKENGANAEFNDCLGLSGCGVANLDDLFLDFAPIIRVERIQCETIVLAKEKAN